MTTITVNIPDNLKNKVTKFIQELGGEIVSETKSSKKNALIKELETALIEAKEIKEGKRVGHKLEDIILGK